MVVTELQQNISLQSLKLKVQRGEKPVCGCSLGGWKLRSRSPHQNCEAKNINVPVLNEKLYCLYHRHFWMLITKVKFTCLEIYHFNMNNSVTIRSFTLYNHHLYPVSNYFHHCKVVPYTHQSVSPHSLSLPHHSASGNHRSIFCLNEFVYSGYFM